MTISRGLQRVEVAEAPSGEASVSRTALRLLLVAGGGGAVVAAAWLGQASSMLGVGVELTRLLQGLALIKGLLVVIATGLTLWRFGQPISLRLAGFSLLCLWSCAAASVLIWELAFLPAAAVFFHLGELSFLYAAFRDQQARQRSP